MHWVSCVECVEDADCGVDRDCVAGNVCQDRFDAGVPDAGAQDAGALDAGATGGDAAVSGDGGVVTPFDAGEPPTGGLSGGCGCRVGGVSPAQSAPLGLLVWLGLVIVRRRRR